MPKISIIVPVYNVEPYLEQCLDSLTNQTLTDIEIICVDDCSTDGSYKIAQQYENKDKRIKLLRTQKNSGQSVARNLGITIARADYLMFCDSDDWYEPTMCQDMLDLIIKNNADLGICSVNVIYETDTNLKNSDKIFQLPDQTFNANSSDIVHKIHNMVNIRIMKQKIIQNNDIRFPVGLVYEDIFFSKIYNLFIDKIATTSKKLYNYRRHTGSTVNQTYSGKSRNSLDYVFITIQYFEYLKTHKLYQREYKSFWTNLFITCAQSALMFTKDPNYSKQLDKILNDFIKKNYIFGTTNKHTDYIISLILDGKLMRYRKHAFGLIQTYYEKNKTEWCIWKICIFKIKHTDSQIKYYLFGICVYKKDKK